MAIKKDNNTKDIKPHNPSAEYKIPPLGEVRKGSIWQLM